ncbi:hypothetical protein ACN20G_27200 (plasmid) [Streptomyces sp. BI20]|uniref:hypothetical protein n=1 Tax=Streptomyces sp. BI20 TaxID=3403460 RepID=UPI003C77070C
MAVPTERVVAGRRFRGAQSWIIEARDARTAIRTALELATTARARRRRRHARIDPSGATAHRLGGPAPTATPETTRSPRRRTPRPRSTTPNRCRA